MPVAVLGPAVIEVCDILAAGGAGDAARHLAAALRKGSVDAGSLLTASFSRNRRAILSGAAEAPPNASPATGVATVTLDMDLITLRVEVSFTGLTGTTTMAHIHAPTLIPLTGTAGVATQVPNFAGFPVGVTSGVYDNTFDLAYGWEILHHIAKPEHVIAEMARVSRKYVLVAEPNPLNLVQFAFALADAEHRWVLRYRLPYMRGLFEKAGLQVIHASSGGWIFPNKTPMSLLPVLCQVPYRSPIGISNWVLGSKRS